MIGTPEQALGDRARLVEPAVGHTSHQELPHPVENLRRPVSGRSYGDEDSLHEVHATIGHRVAARLPAQDLPLGFGASAADEHRAQTWREGFVVGLDVVWHGHGPLVQEEGDEDFDEVPCLLLGETEREQRLRDAPLRFFAEANGHLAEPLEGLALIEAEELLHDPQSGGALPLLSRVSPLEQA